MQRGKGQCPTSHKRHNFLITIICLLRELAGGDDSRQPFDGRLYYFEELTRAQCSIPVIVPNGELKEHLPGLERPDRLEGLVPRREVGAVLKSIPVLLGFLGEERHRPPAPARERPPRRRKKFARNELRLAVYLTNRQKLEAALQELARQNAGDPRLRAQARHCARFFTGISRHASRPQRVRTYARNAWCK